VLSLSGADGSFCCGASRKARYEHGPALDQPAWCPVLRSLCQAHPALGVSGSALGDINDEIELPGASQRNRQGLLLVLHQTSG
jgi:hypothetical protein